MTIENQPLTALPAWVHGTYGDDRKPLPADLPRWFNALPPPAIGQTVKVIINSIGEGIVTGYWVEHNFLGVLVKPFNPPAWYVKQNGVDAEPSVSFGPEVKYEPAKVKICCPDCGSDKVSIDATARWNVEAQAWELASVQDVITCQECEHEFYQGEADDETPAIEITDREAWAYAAQWGSYINACDPGACMYAFNERFEVQSERHRMECLIWLDACRETVAKGMSAEYGPGDRAQIDALVAKIKAAPVKGA
jgi:hypothetical protein